MSEDRVLPTSGYQIDKIYTNKLSLVIRYPREGENGAVFFKSDWKFITALLFEVTLGVKIEPGPGRPEEIEAVFQGRFRKAGEVQSVPLVDFAEQHAPGILMPYARQAIAGMTSQGFFGAYHVHPMNMRAVIADLNVEATGRRQIAEASQETQLALPSGEITPPVKTARAKRSKAKSKEPS